MVRILVAFFVAAKVRFLTLSTFIKSAIFHGKLLQLTIVKVTGSGHSTTLVVTLLDGLFDAQIDNFSF